MNDRTGQQLGNYRLVRLLGQGGFADVYLGEHVYLKMQAAIKLLHTQITDDNMSSFVTEAQTIARLHHPHIIRVLDFGVHDNTPFLVMDYASRGTLRQRHSRGSQLPLPLITVYVRQIAEALEYAHGQKLIHRDIKPENMLLGSNDEILISDFGIATMAQSSHYQMTQDVVGTVAYMAPEQIQGKPRPVSDEYALGIVVYEWLTGSCPFRGSFTEIASQHVFAQPPPLREKVPTLSSEIEQVLLMALAKDPQRRFISLLAFANAFQQAASQDPTWLRHAPTILPLAPSAPTITPVFLPSGQLTATSRSSPNSPTVSATPDPALLVTNMPKQGVAEGTERVSAGDRPLLQRRFSRRSMVLGVGTAVVIGGGVLGWLAMTRSSFAPLRAATSVVIATPNPTPTATASPTPTPTSAPPPTPTPQPQPTAPLPYLGLYRGPSNMYTAAWSPGTGTSIASAGLGSNIEVWSATTQSPLFYCYSSSAKVYSVVWSLDGRRLASGHLDATVQIWDGTNGGHLLTLTGHSKQVNSVAWSPNGQYIASGSGDHTVRIWDANTGSLLNTYGGHISYVNAVAWSPDSTYIASGGGEGTVQVWNALSGSGIYTYGSHSYAILGIAWSPDGSRIASCSVDTTAKVWGAFNGANTLTYNGHSDYVDALGWSPNGRLIASGSKDTTVQIWGATTGSTLHVYHHSDQVEGMTWSPDSTRVASASDDGTVRIWSAV